MCNAMPEDRTSEDELGTKRMFIGYTTKMGHLETMGENAWTSKFRTFKVSDCFWILNEVLKSDLKTKSTRTCATVVNMLNRIQIQHGDDNNEMKVPLFKNQDFYLSRN